MTDDDARREAEREVPAAVRQALAAAGFVPTGEGGNLWFFDRGLLRLCFGEDGSDYPASLADPVSVVERTDDCSDEWPWTEYERLDAALAAVSHEPASVVSRPTCAAEPATISVPVGLFGGDMPISVEMERTGESFDTTLSAFEQANMDGLNEDWWGVRATLLQGGHCFIGGGAAPMFLLRHRPQPRVVYRAFDALTLEPYGNSTPNPRDFFEPGELERIGSNQQDALAHLLECGAVLLRSPETGMAFSIRRVEG